MWKWILDKRLEHAPFHFFRHLLHGQGLARPHKGTELRLRDHTVSVGVDDTHELFNLGRRGFDAGGAEGVSELTLVDLAAVVGILGV